MSRRRIQGPTRSHPARVAQTSHTDRSILQRAGSIPAPLASIAIACVMLLVLAGCAVLDPPRPRDGGSGLSAAAREARKDEEDRHERLTAGTPRPEPVEVTVEEDDCEEVTVAVDPGEPPVETTRHRPAVPGGPRTPPRFRAGLVAGTIAAGGPFQQTGLAGLQLGADPAPRTRLDVALFGAPTRFSPSSRVIGAFDRPAELAVDLSVRQFLSAPARPLGLYAIAGFRLGSLFWDYHHPIVVEDGGDARTVVDDRLDYYAPYAGVGVSLVRRRGMEVGANLTGGARFYDAHSYQGFANDLFRTTGFVQLMLETTFRF